MRTILVLTYARHTRGVIRAAVHVWFSLIGISTLLIYQHHIVDLAGGFALGIACCYAFREQLPGRAVVVNPRIGSYYAFGAVAAAFIAWRSGPWAPLMLWPAIALTIVASAYFVAGPDVFRKQNGVLPASTRFVLGPYLLGQWLSLRYYCLRCRPWDAVIPGVWIGRTLNSREAKRAIDAGVTAVIDLTAEFSENRPFRALPYLNLQILDLTAPLAGDFRQAIEFIEEHRSRGVVYVHCKIGYSRSAAIVAGYLICAGIARDPVDATAMLRAVRPSIVMRSEVRQALKEFARSLDAQPPPSAAAGAPETRASSRTR